MPFETAENKFEALATKDAMANLHGSLNSLATAFYKISNDLKLLSTELKELIITDVSPCEETMMNVIQVMGN